MSQHVSMSGSLKLLSTHSLSVMGDQRNTRPIGEDKSFTTEKMSTCVFFYFYEACGNAK